MHFINNMKLRSNFNYLIIFEFENDKVYVNDLNMHNNTITGNDDALL